MKAYSTQNIRNVVLLGSTKSGKTTLSEAMLFIRNHIDWRGRRWLYVYFGFLSFGGGAYSQDS